MAGNKFVVGWSIIHKEWPTGSELLRKYKILKTFQKTC